MAHIEAICVSEKKGMQKHPVPEAELKADWGIVGDAHAGNWHRQVSILAKESVDRMQEKLTNYQLKAGDFAENILVAGLDLKEAPIGRKIRLGDTVICEVTQIGKECHHDCIIRKTCGDCVMPREGVFLKVLVPGTIKEGDNADILPEE